MEVGGLRRYGDPFWRTPERAERIEYELAVIEDQNYSGTFVMLADVMDYCRRERIPYGPGRGSVGGCYTAYLAGIHDVDSLEWDLLFERFLNPSRVTFPDVDIDVSQRDRPRVLQYIVDKYTTPPIAVTTEVVVSCLEWSALDAVARTPRPDTARANVVVLTSAQAPKSEVQKIESELISCAEQGVQDASSIIKRLTSVTGIPYANKSCGSMAVAASAVGNPTTTFSKWITSTVVAPSNAIVEEETLIKLSAPPDSPTISKSFAAIVITPRLVLVDARITTTKVASPHGQVVLQIGAFVRAGGRAVVDLMLSAMAPHDPNAGATATNLKKCFPETGSITGGQKIARELQAWLYEGKGHGDKKGFIQIAEQAGWLDTMLKLDGMFTHLGKHAAGVVILRAEDLPFIPKVEVRNAKGESFIVTAYDMYSLDDLGYPKWDFLGLRTLDVITEAHKFEGGSGEMEDLLAIWREHRDDPAPYQLLCDADTVGVFQMETDGYRRTLRDFQPTKFDHIVQLVALYRPGAIDYTRADGKNMVQVFIDRMHGREPVAYDHALLEPILRETHGVILYQEQQMAIVRALADFTLAEADALRKAIGKKRESEMRPLMVQFRAGCAAKGIDPAVIERIAENIEAAARYSWNKSHAVEYAIITWWSVWFKWLKRGFYCAEINSWEEKKERQANVIAEARQHVSFRPPDVNVAEDRFIVDGEEIVFGLNGIKGVGDSYRNAILCERLMGGPYASFTEFCERLPSLPISMKSALVKCGAFDSIEDRTRLMAAIPKPGNDPTKRWSVAEHLNHNRKLKNPRPLPDDITVYEFPTDTQIAAGELESMGYYISSVPMAALTKALARHTSNVMAGEVEKVLVKTDKNDNEYGNITVVTPALTKQRVIIFASNWGTFGSRLVKGTQLLFRGRTDNGAFLADACWAPDDCRHHKRIRIQRGEDKPTTEDFDGRIETVLALESAGYRVRLL